MSSLGNICHYYITFAHLPALCDLSPALLFSLEVCTCMEVFKANNVSGKLQYAIKVLPTGKLTRKLNFTMGRVSWLAPWHAFVPLP